jgi:hypothetical protein
MRALSDVERVEITLERVGMLLRAGRHAEASVELEIRIVLRAGAVSRRFSPAAASRAPCLRSDFPTPSAC